MDLYKLIISLIGGAYIFYLGMTMLVSNSQVSTEINNNQSKNSFLNGLITNIFNIKAFLFFVSLFSIIIDNLNGIYFYIYPIYFAAMSSIWFIFLSFVVTTSKNKTFNVYSNKYISSAMSIILCAIGLLILIRSIYEYF